MQETLSTTEEVARYLRVDPVTVRKLVNRGELRAYRVAGEFRFKAADLDEYVQSQVVRPNGEGSGDAGWVDVMRSIGYRQEERMDGERAQYKCLFCGRRNDEVRRMIAGPKGAFICNDCVAKASEIIAAEEAQVPPPTA